MTEEDKYYLAVKSKYDSYLNCNFVGVERNEAIRIIKLYKSMTSKHSDKKTKLDLEARRYLKRYNNLHASYQILRQKFRSNEKGSTNVKHISK